MPAAALDQALHLLQLLVDGLRAGALAERSASSRLRLITTATVELVDLVALADRSRWSSS